MAKNLRSNIFCIMAALGLSLVLALLHADRPVRGALLLRCSHNNAIKLNIEYGRFDINTATVELTAANSSGLNKTTEPGRYTFPQPMRLIFAHEFYTLVYEVTKSSTVKKINFECEGLQSAALYMKSTDTYQVIEGNSVTWPREKFDFLYIPMWIIGIVILTCMFSVLIFIFRGFFSYKNKFDKIIPFIVLSYLAVLYFYYFPGFINPFNASHILKTVTQQNWVLGWEGILYSLLFTSLSEVIPSVQYAVLLQNVIIFLFFTKFIQLGHTTKQRYILLAVLTVFLISSPINRLYTQYFERSVFTAYCFGIILLETYSKLRQDRNYFDKNWFHASVLFSTCLFLTYLRNEYLVIVLPIIVFVFSHRIKKIVLPIVFILVSIGGNKALDKLEGPNKDWRFSYYIVSLSSYFLHIVQNYELSEAEEKIVNTYMDLEGLKSNMQGPLKVRNSLNGTLENLFDLGKIIINYFYQHPFEMTGARLKLGLESLGLRKHAPWVSTPPNRESWDSDRSALEAEIIGTVKLKGDPFYSLSKEIYTETSYKTPFIFSCGILFVFMFLFLFKFYPLTSFVSLIITIRFLVVCMLAPVVALTYVFDVYLFCALIPILAILERKQCGLK